VPGRDDGGLSGSACDDHGAMTLRLAAKSCPVTTWQIASAISALTEGGWLDLVGVVGNESRHGSADTDGFEPSLDCS
jgi:hypothetical protein